MLQKKKAYKLLSLEDKLIFYSRDVRFYENIFPYKMNQTEKALQTDYGGTDHLNFFDTPYTSHNLSNDDDYHPSNNDKPHVLGSTSESDDSHNSSDDKSDSDASARHDGSSNEGSQPQSATLLEPSEAIFDSNTDGVSEDNRRSKRNSVMPRSFKIMWLKERLNMELKK